MYESFFGFQIAPFSLSPDPRFLWMSETHQEALSALERGLQQQARFLVLTGEVGSGKTTLVRAVMANLSSTTEPALILDTVGLLPLDSLKLIAADLGLPGSLGDLADYRRALARVFNERRQLGRVTLLIIDEAQNLDAEVLYELERLSQPEGNPEAPLQIVLTGQPELLDNLAHPSLRALREQIALEHRIGSLSRDEVGGYLRHRIEVAGGAMEQVFAPGVEDIFFWFSRGCPRLMSLLADRALLSAYAKLRRPVSCELLEQKAKEMSAAPLPRKLSRACR